MYINLESDYAIRITVYLSKKNVLTDAKTIAEDVGVTLRFCLKILRKLTNTGVLKSYKGSKGGYVMNKDPREVSLKEIIEIIEGPIVVSRCLDGTYDCRRPDKGEVCKIQLSFLDITNKIKYEFAKVSIKDLIWNNRGKVYLCFTIIKTLKKLLT